MKTTNKKTIILASLLLGACGYHTSTQALFDTLFASIKQSFSTSYDFVVKNNTILIDGRYLIPFSFFGDITTLDVRQHRNSDGFALEVRDKGPNGPLIGAIFLDKSDSKELACMHLESLHELQGRLSMADEKAGNIELDFEEKVAWISEDGTSMPNGYMVTIKKKEQKE